MDTRIIKSLKIIGSTKLPANISRLKKGIKTIKAFFGMN